MLEQIPDTAGNEEGSVSENGMTALRKGLGGSIEPILKVDAVARVEDVDVPADAELEDKTQHHRERYVYLWLSCLLVWLRFGFLPHFHIYFR